MALSEGDKKWVKAEIARIFKRSVAHAVEQAVQNIAQHGGYDGATTVTEDDYAEEAHRRVGFNITPVDSECLLK